MATFNPAAGAPVARSVSTHGLKGNLKVMQGTVAVTTALATADIINFFYLPAGATIRSASLQASVALDSNASPVLTIDVGDSGGDNRIYDASTVGQGTTVAARKDNTPLWASIGYQYTADTLIYGTVELQAATAVAGSLTLTVEYTVDGLAS
jgi:hypothetical protein